MRSKGRARKLATGRSKYPLSFPFSLCHLVHVGLESKALSALDKVAGDTLWGAVSDNLPAVYNYFQALLRQVRVGLSDSCRMLRCGVKQHKVTHKQAYARFTITHSLAPSPAYPVSCTLSVFLIYFYSATEVT